MGKDIYFQKFLSSIGDRVSGIQLKELKRYLVGHVEKEIVDLIHSGHDLVFTLVNLKLLNKRKLAFLQNLFRRLEDGNVLIKLIDDYKSSQLQRQDFSNNEDSDARLETMRMMEKRQFITLGEYQNILENTLMKYRGVKQRQNDLLKSLSEAKEKLKDEKNVMEDEWWNVQILNEIKNEKESDRNTEFSKLKKLISEKEKLNYTIEKIHFDLNRKGTERLNTFDKSLGKKEAMKCEETLASLIKKITNQQECVKRAKKEVKMFSLEKSTQMKRARLSDINVQDRSMRLHNEYNELEEINENIICAMDDIFVKKDHLILIENQIKLTKNDISDIHNNAAITKSIGEDSLNLPALLNQGKPKEMDYSLFGANSFTISIHDLSHPAAIKIDKNGDILIADQDNQRLLLVTIEGFVKEIIKLDTLSPIDIAIDNRNYFSVIGESEIRIYNSTIMLTKFLPHYITGQLPNLVSIAANNDDELYVLDKANITIQIFSFEGQFKGIQQLSEYVTSPSRIHFLNSKEFIISDDGDHSIKIFHPEHMYICRKFGGEGYGLCEYVFPTGIDNDRLGNLIIADSGNHRIHVVNNEGKHIAVYGRFGKSNANFDYPIDVAVHQCGMIIIADANNNRITVYF